MLKMFKSTKNSYINTTPDNIHVIQCIEITLVKTKLTLKFLRNHFLRFINLKLHVQKVLRNYQDVELLSYMGTRELIAK